MVFKAEDQIIAGHQPGVIVSLKLVIVSSGIVRAVEQTELFPTFFDGFSSKNKSQNHPSQMLYILHRNVYNRSIEWEDSTNES